MNGVELIAAERQRQIKSEGWTAEHDDTWTQGQLGFAALRYINITLPPSEFDGMAVDLWPWSEEWFKVAKGGDIRSLVKAGALIAAEIDRQQRLEPEHD